MRNVIAVGAACVLGALTAACAEPPVRPIPETARRSVAAVSADVSGMKNSDTSKLGARGSDEGGRLGVQQGVATVMGNTGGGSLLGLILMPIGAAVGGAKGASEARSAEVVDQTRSNLRLAIQETDFTELLRQRLATSKAAGAVEIAVTSGPSSAPPVTSAGAPVGHVIALEYRLNLYSEYLVNPLIGVYVQVTAQVQSQDRKQLIHSATWTYCGERSDFVQMAAGNAALFRAQINDAAVVLGEAIPYDLYVSTQPRALKAKQLGAVKTVISCMDFSDLPSRTGKQIPVSFVPPPPAPAPQSGTAPQPAPVSPVAAPAVASPIPVASVAAPVPPPAIFDGAWQIEMQLSTTYGTTVGGECPTHHNAPVTFTNRSAEGSWGRLRLAGDGELDGWMNVPPAATSMLPFLVNVSGHMDDNVVKGSVSGRCTGSFVMRKQ